MPTAPDPGHEPPLQEVAHTIRRLRKARGLSMAALAELAGLSQPFISQLESGAHTPSLMTLYRVATALGVVPGALFGETAFLPGPRWGESRFGALLRERCTRSSVTRRFACTCI